MKVPTNISLPSDGVIEKFPQFIKNLIWKLKTALEEISQAINMNAGFGAIESTEKTIASGIIDVGAGYVPFRQYTVDTESNDSTDDLDTINGGHAGELLIILAANTDRTVIAKNGAGLKLAEHFSMDNTEDILLLRCTSTNVWAEVSRSNNGA